MVKQGIQMISFDEAYEIVMASSLPTGTEIVPWTESMDRVLAENVVSDIDLPPFNKSSVDGFACRRSDLHLELEIIETIPAGKWPVHTLKEAQCSRIMTGAPVPEGADCIIMVEGTETLPSGRMKFIGSFTKENIAFKGEDIRENDVVLEKGRLIKPQDIAVFASVGHVSVRVGKKPRIAVLSSGSELVEPSEKPGMSGIRNSNSSQLMAQIARAGASGVYYGIAEDDEDVTLSLLKSALAQNDIVLITGGVSMGDFDFVPAVLEKAGVKLLFRRIAVQPGKPTTFGKYPNGLVFGLPGNPVSSFIQFEMLVRPLIYKMMGHDWKPFVVNLPMKERFTRKYSERMALVPVKITKDNTVVPVEYHGSAHISALNDADGVISMPAGKTVLEKGEATVVRQI
jgi:molybdopterin molybdotransferase